LLAISSADRVRHTSGTLYAEVQRGSHM
jgi:hypothetical protein